MGTTLLMSQIMGISLLVIGISMFMRRKMVIRIFDDVFNSRGLTYMLGITELILGLMVILNQDLLGGALPTVVLALGWLLLLEGIVYVFASNRLMKRFLSWLHDRNVYNIITIVYLLLGAYLTFYGFSLTLM